MRAILCLGSLGLLVAHTAIASAAPTWCKGGDQKPSYDMKSLFTEQDPFWGIPALVAASCYPDSDVASMEKQIAKARDAWSKKLGLVESDWVDVNEWAHKSNSERGSNAIDFDVNKRKTAWSALTPIDQLAVLGRGDIYEVDVAYVADAMGAKLSELGRLGYVVTCLDGGGDPAVRYAMCAPDAAALDMTKLNAEIRADTEHTGTDRMVARIIAWRLLTEKLPAFQTEVKTLRAKDPAYATMFDLGQAAHRDWKPDATLQALVTSLDDAHVTGSRKASAGCSEKAWAGWTQVVQGLGAKKLETIHAEPGNELLPQMLGMLTSTADGYLAALALNQCAVLADKQDDLSEMIGGALVRWPGLRGPRTATHTAILTSGLQLDDTGAQLDYPEIKRDFIRGTGNVGAVGNGRIDSIKVDGERATITFKKEKVTQKRCTKGHRTNRITRIDSFGAFVYEYVCDKEITETIDVEPSPPLKVVARTTAGMKPGMTVHVSDNIAMVAFSAKGAVVNVTGIEVK
jgi:hypothetical protein